MHLQEERSEGVVWTGAGRRWQQPGGNLGKLAAAIYHSALLRNMNILPLVTFTAGLAVPRTLVSVLALLGICAGEFFPHLLRKGLLGSL